MMKCMRTYKSRVFLAIRFLLSDVDTILYIYCLYVTFRNSEVSTLPNSDFKKYPIIMTTLGSPLKSLHCY